MTHRYVWYSFCSIHREIDPQCATCHAGQWVDENDPEVIADRQLYEDDPDEWRRRHNDFPAAGAGDREGNTMSETEQDYDAAQGADAQDDTAAAEAEAAPGADEDTE